MVSARGCMLLAPGMALRPHGCAAVPGSVRICTRKDYEALCLAGTPDLAELTTTRAARRSGDRRRVDT